MTPTNNASTWHEATVASITDETPTVKSFVFTLPQPAVHLAGQHYEIRLTAADGYQAARLYSAASLGTGDNALELTIALLPDGEVSPYLHEVLAIGDQVEIRGPLGKFFVWRPEDTQPVLLIGGGSGIVPMRCILQTHQQTGSTAPIHVLYSARTYDEIIYKDELLGNEQVTITLSDSKPADWQGASGRITPALLQATLEQLAIQAAGTVYICGTNGFVEAMAQHAVDLGVPSARIKAERFGA